MSELALRGDTSPALIPDAAAGLVEWAQAASAAHRLATGLVGTSFVPAAYKGKPDEAAAAILAGSEVGLSPMASLRAFDNIQGTATPKAITVRAVMLRLGCEIEVEESTAARCIMRGRRSAGANWTTVEWTMDRARKMGLDKKSQWQSQPGAMLVARCTTELGRLIAADALLGLGYTSEELSDEAPEPTAKVARKAVQRKAAPATPEPDFEDEPEPQPEPVATILPVDPTEVMLTNAQSNKLHALLREAGIVDRAVGLAYIGDIIGRDVESTKTLTKAEASKAIDQIEREKEPAEDKPTDDAQAGIWPEVAGA